MKTSPFSAIVGGALGLSACASKDQALAPTSPTTWETEHFYVRFIAGPRSPATGKSSSRYQVTSSRLGSSTRLEIESEHSTGGFESVTNPEPSNYIRLLEDPRTEALLIQETIPNDCGPCSNYIWIRPAGANALASSYLNLPERSDGTNQGIDSAFPEVTSLRNGTLTYRYPKGPPTKAKIDRLPTLQSPTPPG